MPSSAICSSSSTVSSAPVPSKRFWHISTKLTGYSLLAGSAIKSRVNSTPSATAAATSHAASAPSLAPTTIALFRETFCSSFSFVRYASCLQLRRRKPSKTDAVSAAFRPASLRSSTISLSPEVRYLAARAAPAFSNASSRLVASAPVSPAPAIATRTV